MPAGDTTPAATPETPAAPPETASAPAPLSPWAARLVRWLPAILGAGLAAAGMGAAGLAASQVSVTVKPPEVSPGPDPLALLRDDVASLQGDVGQLRKGVGSGIQALGRHLDKGAEDRHTEVLDGQDALTKQLVQLRKAQAALARRQAKLDEHVAALRVAPVAGQPVKAAPKVEKIAAKKPAKRPAKKKVEPEPEPVVKVRRRRRRRGLFGFKLKGGGPDFTQRQRYTVIASLSRVGFDAKSTLHDFSGVTSKVQGEVVARLDKEDAHAHGQVSADVSALKTGVDGRDEEMRKVMNATKYPRIAFKLERLVPKKVDVAARTFTGEAHGVFTIHGIAKKVVVKVKASVDRSRRLLVKGEVPLEMTDFKLEVPSVAGAIKVEDRVRVWLSLRLRTLGRVQESSK